MVLTDARRRVEELGWHPSTMPSAPVASCNLCGSTSFVVVTHGDRYGFPVSSSCCRACGLVFLDPRPTDEAYAAFYGDTYRPLVSAFHGRRIEAETVEREQATYASALGDLLAPFLDGRGSLLDVGGSTGVVAEALVRRFGLSALVLDPSPDELARAAARGLETEPGTIEGWDPAGRRFDAVLLCQTIDHLLDVSGSLTKLRSVVAPGGLLFVDIVDFRAAYLRAWSVEAATKVDHPYSLTEPVAEAFLARAGFRILRVDYAADHLHVGFVCAPTDPEPDAVTSPRRVEHLLREIRMVQNAPAPG